MTFTFLLSLSVLHLLPSIFLSSTYLCFIPYLHTLAFTLPPSINISLLFSFPLILVSSSALPSYMEMHSQGECCVWLTDIGQNTSLHAPACTHAGAHRHTHVLACAHVSHTYTHKFTCLVDHMQQLQLASAQALSCLSLWGGPMASTQECGVQQLVFIGCCATAIHPSIPPGLECKTSLGRYHLYPWQ